MKIVFSLVCTLIILSGIILIPNAFAENVPEWVKNTAGWWATDAISETEFVNAVEFLIKENIIQVDASQTPETSQSVPEWVKNTAGWWAMGQIDDETFISGIEYLVKVGIITIDKECKFFAEEYNHIKKPQQKMLCEFSDFDFVDFWYSPYEPKNNEINSFGFRGTEFSKEKPLGTYRIFMVGGSTVFGDGVENHNTIPSLLQNFYLNDKFDNIKQIEVINAGINGGISKHEADLIKNKISKMSPDLIVIYDGWNDSKIGSYGQYIEDWDAEVNDVAWKNRWIDVCNLYNKEFDIIVALQPLLTYKIFLKTDQEFTNYVTRDKIIEEARNLDGLATHLNELNTVCSSAHDLRDIMKNVSVGIYYDQGHMTPTGNKIIAKKIYEITLPIIEKNSVLITSLNDKKVEDESKKYQTELNSIIDYRGKLTVGTDFSSENIPNIVAYFSTFKETDFSSSNLRNMDVKFSRFVEVDFSNAKLQNSKISRSLFMNSDFSHADLSQSYLSTSTIINSDLRNSVFKNSDLRGVLMINSILENTIFENVNFSNSQLKNIDFTKTTLKNSKFNGAEIIKCVLYEMDFSTLEIHGDKLTGSPTDFVSCSMKYSNFSKVNMNNVDFTSKEITRENEIYSGSDLSYSTFTGVDLRTTMFSMWSSVDHKTLHTKYEIPIGVDPLDLVRNTISPKLEYVTFDNVDLRDNDLSLINLKHSQITDSNLANTSLKNSDLSFSSIINSDLSGANLEGANLEGVILDNVIFTGANLKCDNHTICESG